MVVDGSVALAWCFEDEFDAHATRVLQVVAKDGGSVPSLWALEVANGLLVGKRRGRLTPADVERFLTLFLKLPLTVDDLPMEQALKAVLPMAQQFGLTVYDATYLELAMREGRALATKDRQLMAAARECGVTLV